MTNGAGREAIATALGRPAAATGCDQSDLVIAWSVREEATKNSGEGGWQERGIFPSMAARVEWNS